MSTIDFMKLKNLFLSISLFLFIGTFLISGIKNINWGIDFTGGYIIQCKMDKPAPLNDIRELLKSKGIEASVIKFDTPKEFLIKIGLQNKNVNTEKVFKIVQTKYENLELRRTEKIGAKIGNELVEKGLIALFLTILTILLYVSFRFEWRFAVASSIALFHDVIITFGFLILLGININLDILAALLTILGYSINDTIVVLDRIRENLNETKETNLNKLLNLSINNTLTRTLLTSLTTLFVIVSVYLFGGDMVSGLAITLLIGIVIGTYSSIFIASPLLDILKFNISNWKKKEEQKLKRKKERERERALYENGVL